MQENENITVYYKGHLIFGEEPPADGLLMRESAHTLQETKADVVYDELQISPNPWRNGNLTLHMPYSLTGKIVSVRIINAAGVNVYQTRAVNINRVVKLQINKQLVAGICFLQVNDLPAGKLVIAR